MAANIKSITELELYAMSVAELEKEIQHHNYLYWDLNAPEISDEDYDRLVERLKRLQPDSPVLQELGPAEIGRASAVVTHSVPMLSLDKCYNNQDLQAWASKFKGEIMVTPKMDGIAISLRYNEQGDLHLAATRGTGLVGDEVTNNARTIKDIQPHIPGHNVEVRNVEVRGEIYMPLSVFASYADQFSNPRNLAAGALKHKNPVRCQEYRLSFAAYDLLGVKCETEQAKLDYLQHWGFPVPQPQLVDHHHLEEAYKHFAAIRNTLDYEIDGVVFKANLVEEQRRLGSTAHHPRYAMAYKFQGDSAATTLRRVGWSVARSGVITPIAFIEPVNLSGAMVSRASLHNAGFLKKLELLGNPPGAQVMVTRRGGVIPKVEYVVEPSPPASDHNQEIIDYPSTCPSCGGPVRLEGDFIYCANPEACRDARISALGHYCATLDILGFGNKLLTQAFESETLKSPPDLYPLTENDLLRLERVGPKLAAKLIKEIREHRQIELPTFLRALGIDELGPHVAMLLSNKYGELEPIRHATAEELASVHTIGPEIAKNVVQGLKAKSSLIDQLLEHVTILSPAINHKNHNNQPLAGQSFVFTGTLRAFDRKTAQEKVTRLGGEIPSTVTKHLTYLVIGEETEARKSSKQVKAEKYRAEGAPLTIINESKFLKLIGEH